MPPAIIAAGIGAAGTLGGTIMASRSANRASRYQYDAQREAMQYQRDRDAAAKAERDQAYQRYKDDYDAWLFRNYGVKGKSMSGADRFKAPGGGATAQAPVPGAPAPGGKTLGDMAYQSDPTMTSPSAPPVPTAPPGAVPGVPGTTLRDMADKPGEWNDWRNYGLA